MKFGNFVGNLPLATFGSERVNHVTYFSAAQMIDKCFPLTTEFMPQGTLTETTYDCYQIYTINLFTTT